MIKLLDRYGSLQPLRIYSTWFCTGSFSPLESLGIYSISDVRTWGQICRVVQTIGGVFQARRVCAIVLI